jgi:hypothetical protein
MIECALAVFIFLYTQYRRLPPPPPPTATVKLASDWLGVGLEPRNFCYWTLTKTGNQRIDKWLLSKYVNVNIDYDYDYDYDTVLYFYSLIVACREK